MGNTEAATLPLRSGTVHPRVCGEHIFFQQILYLTFGSSPRMWGTPLKPDLIPFRQRFIPAYVGNTRPGTVLRDILLVHPRVCGEHAITIAVSLRFCGSSPRMWGTRKPSHARKPRGRFIPAYVGNTQYSLPERGLFQVHPRVCGEHKSLIHSKYSPPGSSPRMWGTRINSAPAPRGIAVHPRVCGEHTGIPRSMSCIIGSSPRMWGTLHHFLESGKVDRFIPAYVGNTFPCVTRSRKQAVHPRVCGEHT